ncbi:MAG: ParB/RepB/Spo0J family partition protein [Lentimicrobiaceae bacterium]|jgi:ParB family chromosome partitioning protein|nr:ParB/RepB/Spo0J family partition protein [Lentimicrobiaceae bacterium]MCP4910804.1 ParB/RepB/Spo0J family partition protein [Bacteroidota bacterium]MBT3455276.1 ParB/RepB/Spo0J family partition protein [Lentimicrobiaceae bacterium]MBT3817724.1 ParB/RepB/Spo0J family partition protein [Lentimicrobiaceae bacterium]MBT4062310.1 ParB/RepB/Spo0J family partition protein [Lentimicrobiaceae bacterium]
MSNKGKKRALGRGLDSILSSPDTDITSVDISGEYVAGAIADLEINKIETNPFQPRTEFDEMMLRELSDSIKIQGIIQPVTVRKMGYDRYQIISGERRLRASHMAGIKKIPAFIRVANDEQMLELALIENIHREDLNAIEIAISYQRLIDEINLTQEKLSEKVGKSRSSISNFLRLLKLPPELQIALRDKSISMGHARALITLPDKKTQTRILKNIIDRDLNVRQTEELVRNMMAPAVTPTKKNDSSIPEKFKTVPANLSIKLGTKVNLRRNNNGEGAIVITFKNDDDLDKIISIIEGSK